MTTKEFDDLPLQTREIEPRLLLWQFLDNRFNNI